MDKTDAALKKLEKQIKSVYTKAYQELKEEAASVLAKIELNPDMPLSQKMALMSKYDRLNTLSDQLSKTAYEANSTAQRMINNEMVNIYEINYNGDAEKFGFALTDNTAIKKILKEEENPFNMISSLRDKTGIRNEMKGQLMTGLLKGEGIPKIARRLKNISEKSLKDSIRIARTETTRVVNSAKMDIGAEGQRLGFDMWKRWVATTDGRVREDHLAMNGVEVPQDSPFVLPDGSKVMFPGDISMGAPPEQTINCRCIMVEFIKEVENKEENFENENKSTVVETKPLTKNEKDAVEYYVSGDGMYINNPLRGRKNSEGYSLTMEDLNEQDLALIKDLDKATDRLLEPQTVFRSVDASAIFGDMSQSEYENLHNRIYGANDKYSISMQSRIDNTIGKTIIDKGFVSTTRDYEIARDFGDFTGSEKPVVLEILTSSKTRGLTLADEMSELNERMEQDEVLLARNQKMEILSISMKDGNIYIKAKMK